MTGGYRRIEPTGDPRGWRGLYSLVNFLCLVDFGPEWVDLLIGFPVAF